MASIRGWRFAAMSIAAVLCSMTFSVTAPAYFDGGGGTTSATMPTCDNVIVLSFTIYDQPASAWLLPVVKEERIASHFPAFRPSAIKERASRSAVRPTAVSGWRSGRVRTLAA